MFNQEAMLPLLHLAVHSLLIIFSNYSTSIAIFRSLILKMLKNLNNKWYRQSHINTLCVEEAAIIILQITVMLKIILIFEPH